MRVLVVDARPVMRAGLRAIVESAGDLEWAGDADALGAGDRIDAAVVSSPVAAVRTAAQHPAAGLVLLTPGEDDAVAAAAVHSGVRCRIGHRASADDVVRAIRAAGHDASASARPARPPRSSLR